MGGSCDDLDEYLMRCLSLQMLHTVASDLAGLPLDFTDPVTQLLHTVT
jgi:hypothetical protein